MPFFRLLFLLLVADGGSSGDGGGGGGSNVGGCYGSRIMVAAPTWCVARSSKDNTSLQAALDYACGAGTADCSPISSNGLCFLPNTLQAHASYAMNSYYQRSGNTPSSCDFNGAAVIAMSDPSYGSCVYPSSASATIGTSPITTMPTPTTTPVNTPTTTTTPVNTPTTTTTPVNTPTTTTTPVTTPTTLPVTTPTPTTTMPTSPTFNPANPSPITAGGGLSPPGQSSPTASNAIITTCTGHSIAATLFLSLAAGYVLSLG